MVLILQTIIKHGSSKANRLRTFWELESDLIVGKVIDSLLDLLLTQRDPCIASDPGFLQAKEITSRLLGKSHQMENETEQEFLEKDFKNVSFNRLDIEPRLTDVILVNLVLLK